MVRFLAKTVPQLPSASENRPHFIRRARLAPTAKGQLSFTLDRDDPYPEKVEKVRLHSPRTILHETSMQTMDFISPKRASNSKRIAFPLAFLLFKKSLSCSVPFFVLIYPQPLYFKLPGIVGGDLFSVVSNRLISAADQEDQLEREMYSHSLHDGDFEAKEIHVVEKTARCFGFSERRTKLATVLWNP